MAISTSQSKPFKYPVILDGRYFKVTNQPDSNGKVQAECVECKKLPDKADKFLISGFITPTSNFTTHLKRKHPAEFTAYEKYLNSSEVKNKRAKQSTIQFPRTVTSSLKARIDNLIIDYIISSMVSLRTVEHPAFIKLLKGINPDVHVMSRNTIKSKIISRYTDSKQKLTVTLGKATGVCITADVWSSTSRSFMGVTVHWIDEDLKRHSAVLALKRFQGRHTHDRIADLLSEIFLNFGLDCQKIVAVVTDNGSNFIKAFQEYGIHLDVDDDQSDEEETLPEEIISTVNIEEIESETVLPNHVRCASHTLSLVATKDLEKSLESSNIPLKKLFRSTIAKCSALWNKLSRSVQIAENIKEICGKSIMKPVPTRWNSLYDSIRSLLEVKTKLVDIFAVAKVEKLKPQELEFLESYMKSMGPVAWALDKLQSEKDFYYGFLSPILIETIFNLDLIITGKNYSLISTQIAGILKTGVQKRFSNVANWNLEACKMELLAAVSMPYFKLRWVRNDIMKDEIKRLFVEEAKQFINLYPNIVNQTENSGSNEVSKEGASDNFFSFDRNGVEDFGANEVESSVELECLNYLNDKSQNLQSLKNYPIVKAIFMRYNTILPSSAPAERLFSYGGMVMQPKRSRMSDDLFEQLVFLKLNEDFNLSV